MFARSTLASRVVPGFLYLGIMPHSEVCIHMRVADRIMPFSLSLNRRSVQLYDFSPEGSIRKFSSPILPGEAGLYEIGMNDWPLSDGAGPGYYFYPTMTEEMKPQ